MWGRSFLSFLLISQLVLSPILSTNAYGEEPSPAAQKLAESIDQKEIDKKLQELEERFQKSLLSDAEPVLKHDSYGWNLLSYYWNEYGWAGKISDGVIAAIIIRETNFRATTRLKEYYDLAKKYPDAKALLEPHLAKYLEAVSRLNDAILEVPQEYRNAVKDKLSTVAAREWALSADEALSKRLALELPETAAAIEEGVAIEEHLANKLNPHLTAVEDAFAQVKEAIDGTSENPDLPAPRNVQELMARRGIRYLIPEKMPSVPTLGELAGEVEAGKAPKSNLETGLESRAAVRGVEARMSAHEKALAKTKRWAGFAGPEELAPESGRIQKLVHSVRATGNKPFSYLRRTGIGLGLAVFLSYWSLRTFFDRRDAHNNAEEVRKIVDAQVAAGMRELEKGIAGIGSADVAPYYTQMELKILLDVWTSSGLFENLAPPQPIDLREVEKKQVGVEGQFYLVYSKNALIEYMFIKTLARKKLFLEQEIDGNARDFNPKDEEVFAKVFEVILSVAAQEPAYDDKLKAMKPEHFQELGRSTAQKWEQTVPQGAQSPKKASTKPVEPAKAPAEKKAEAAPAKQEKK